MVLGKLALVGQGPLRQIILPEGFLQEQIAGVGVIAQDSGNAGLAPVVFIPGRNLVRVQPVGDGFNTFPCKVFPKDAPNDLCLIRLNNEDAVPVPIGHRGNGRAASWDHHLSCLSFQRRTGKRLRHQGLLDSCKVYQGQSLNFCIGLQESL